jgi:hypothetical protein
MKNTQSNYKARVNALQSNLDRLVSAQIAKTGTQGAAGKDIEVMLSAKNTPTQFTESVSAQIDAWGIDGEKIFSPSVNPKVSKRMVQFVAAVQGKTYKNVDRTSACIVLALHLAGDFNLTTEALREIATGGKVREGGGADRRGVSVRTVQRLLGAVGTGTIDTQLSRSVGKNGFLNASGATTGEPGVNHTVKLNRSHPMVQAFISMIDGATSGQLDEMIKDKA